MKCENFCCVLNCNVHFDLTSTKYCSPPFFQLCIYFQLILVFFFLIRVCPCVWYTVLHMHTTLDFKSRHSVCCLLCTNYFFSHNCIAYLCCNSSFIVCVSIHFMHHQFKLRFISFSLSFVYSALLCSEALTSFSFSSGR